LSFLRKSTDICYPESPCSEMAVSCLALSDWSEHGLAWATFASQEALMHADKLSVENVQVFQNLAMYWFAAGQTAQANIYEG
jgi:hypothetical protein